MPMKRVNSLSHFAVREATAIAADSALSGTQKAANASEYCKNVKTAIEFQILSLQAEQRLLADFADLSDSDMISSLFSMIDKDKDRLIHSSMIRRLGNVHGEYNFEEIIFTALKKCLPIDDKHLNFIEFEELFNNLLQEMGCSALELAELIIVQSVFSTTGSMLDKVINRVDSKDGLSSDASNSMGFNRVNSMQSFANPDVGCGFGGAVGGGFGGSYGGGGAGGFNRINSFVDLNGTSRTSSSGNVSLGGFRRNNSMSSFTQFDQGEEKQENFEQEYKKALVDQRMKALFNLFDVENHGGINFKEVVLGLYKITEGLDTTSRAAVDALLMFDDNQRMLRYEEFTKLIINFVAASPKNVKFDDVADSMTRHAAQPIKMDAEELTHLFAMDSSLLALKDLHGKEEVHAAKLSPAVLAKITRLFKLLDEDKDNFLNFHELALGLRKFQETTQLKDTVEESLQVMTAFDSDNDQKLSFKEFSQFIIKYAGMIGSNMTDLLDFMIVAGALKENSDSEKNYINAISNSDIYYWGY